MNMTTFSSPDNQEAAHLEKLRLQISTDIEAMHQQEASLKEYEQRLRLLVDHAHQNQPTPPLAAQYFVTSAGPDRTELDSQWEKYERSHALLEAARRGLCDDRMAVKDREQRVQLRELEVARREAWLKVRDQEIAAWEQARAKEESDAKARPTFTTAPFLAARNLFTRQG